MKQIIGQVSIRCERRPLKFLRELDDRPPGDGGFVDMLLEGGEIERCERLCFFSGTGPRSLSLLAGTAHDGHCAHGRRPRQSREIAAKLDDRPRSFVAFAKTGARQDKPNSISWSIQSGI